MLQAPFIFPSRETSHFFRSPGSFYQRVVLGTHIWVPGVPIATGCCCFQTLLAGRARLHMCLYTRVVASPSILNIRSGKRKVSACVCAGLPFLLICYFLLCFWNLTPPPTTVGLFAYPQCMCSAVSDLFTYLHEKNQLDSSVYIQFLSSLSLQFSLKTFSKIT